MKLLIKKKWFDLIKSGEKDVEFRDAHITFVCEETGRTLRKDISRVGLSNKDNVIMRLGISKKEGDELFEDEKILEFHLKEEK